jgi:two-component system, cell cycle response regulator DivK
MTASPTVLVVDDDQDNREMLAEYLTLSGCTVATASSGAEAIRVAEQMRPQVMLMDLALPGMDGWEATRRVKAHPLLKQTVVIAVTAHGLPNHKEKAMHAGCQAVIVKPYNLVALAEQVRRVVAEDGMEPAAARAHES